MISPSEVSFTCESRSTSTLCLNRPRALNALTLGIITSISDEYKRILETKSRPPQIIVLKGSGGKVCPCERAECAQDGHDVANSELQRPVQHCLPYARLHASRKYSTMSRPSALVEM